MKRFLVEAYTPATIEVADVEEPARRAAENLVQAGTDVEYVWAAAVMGAPDDEFTITAGDCIDTAIVDGRSCSIRLRFWPFVEVLRRTVRIGSRGMKRMSERSRR